MNGGIWEVVVKMKDGAWALYLFVEVKCILVRTEVSRNENNKLT